MGKIVIVKINGNYYWKQIDFANGEEKSFDVSSTGFVDRDLESLVESLMWWNDNFCSFDWSLELHNIEDDGSEGVSYISNLDEFINENFDNKVINDNSSNI